MIPPKATTPLEVAFFVCGGFQLLDVSGPLSVFQAAGRVGAPAYTLTVVSATGGSVTGNAGLPLPTVPAAAVRPDTVVVAGGDIDPMLAPEAVVAVRGLAARARRTTSVCTGSFLLAEAGLLDGRTATTHWRYARRLQARHRAVAVDADRIFTSDGPVWTSAGVTAGVDLALALVEADGGAERARRVARELVVYHRRTGGQSQFSALAELEPRSDRVRDALTYARDHLGEELPVERLAAAACLSPRQFTRLCRAETGDTPAKAVERLRVEAAREQLRDGDEPVGRIATTVGFGAPERMRRAFVRLHGLSPQAVRRAAR